MKPAAGCLLVLVTISSSLTARAQAAAPTKIMIDMTDAPRKFLHAHLIMPVEPGPLTLVYPKWIPGEHGPTGPIANLAGLVMQANGQTLTWKRDDVDMYSLHVDVPQGASSLDIRLDFLATAAPTGYSAGASTTANLAMLSWNEVVLYPAGKKAADVRFEPSVKLPEDWKYGTALTKTAGDNADLQFETVSLEQLVDSPLLSGKYFREIPLAPEITPKHYLDLVADGPAALDVSAEQVKEFSNLVRETGALYRSRHYRSYHFLMTLSDEVAHFGLEHHESSDDRVPENTLIDSAQSLLEGSLLPHEFTHSWNGKYRRPEGLATANYQEPMKGDLLWVYEGLTEYLGDLLAARSHIWTAEQYREALAYTAGLMDFRPGRTWRDLADTAVAAQTFYGDTPQWDNWRRNVDYYDEGELIWLEADTIIRNLSGGKKSMNDFCARFHGLGGDTAPKVVPYTFEDIVSNLNAVQPSDWSTFLHERLTTKAPHAPLNGIANGGYRLSFQAYPTEYEAARERGGKVLAWWSVGLVIDGKGTIDDVLVGSPADKAGLGPGMRIVAVNGREYSSPQLKLSIDQAKDAQSPIQMIVSNASYYKIVSIDYHGGQRYPYLERVNGTHDLLDAILEPLTKEPKT